MSLHMSFASFLVRFILIKDTLNEFWSSVSVKGVIVYSTR